MRHRVLLLLLPFLLLLATGALLGGYFETNDDLTIVALLRGTTAADPVTNLHLYFHGYAALWSRLYAAAPRGSWYGLTLYGLLYAATVLAAAVLWRVVRPRAGTGAALALLGLFWLVGWLEHGFWFNYVRVPLLLAGAGVLFAAQRAPARWALAVGLLAFGLSWLIRPSAAVLGAAVALPGAWWLAGRRAGPVVAGAAAWAVLGALGLQLTRSPAAASFRRLDVLKSNLNDFRLAAPPTTPLRPADSLALAAAQAWQLADSALVNEAALARVAPFRPGYFLGHTAPAKLGALARQLPRDYFPLLLLLAATGALVLRAGRGHRVFWLVQAAYAGLGLGLGVLLKLPPRLALPLFDFWAFSNLVYLWQLRPLPRHSLAVLLLALLAAAGPYAYKTRHRSQLLAREQARNRQQRRQLSRLASGARVVVSDALEETYKSAAPFSEGAGGAACAGRPGLVWLSVRGWQTLHPSQAVLRQRLTGTRDFTAALRRLGQRPDVAWLLTPEGAVLLNRQLALGRLPDEPMARLEHLNRPKQLAPGFDGVLKGVQAYQMRIKFPQSTEKDKIM
ncbi:hypothetical protein [Hymenobacter rubripertinctus]|uniref:Glycosyltransferase RgtA/B/C/D-like domain-containing protein n=1 Tax=Hymenobacter rubripertinctus TaxID=2029981 RepID=A0A418R7L8_9BACT|nr:hypothetical protein [Hymenobacter rubripertinctus]RIY13379.1 hypothetical protein D0T11_02790 [Hymenobacter rubripertinctus]